MFDRLTENAQRLMRFARQEAQRLKHDWIGTEHLLLGLLRLDDGVAITVLQHLGIDLDELWQAVERAVTPGSTTASLDQLPFTPNSKRALEQSMSEAQGLGHEHFGTEHLLLAAEVKSKAGRVLKKVGKLAVDELRAAVMTSREEPSSPPREVLEESHRTTCKLVWTHWYKNGQKRAEGSYEARVRQGPWTFWNKDGSLDYARSGMYEDGKRLEP